jgi:hypothetical protein
VDFPQVICHLAHQIVLVGRAELAEAFLVPALELMHPYSIHRRSTATADHTVIFD